MKVTADSGQVRDAITRAAQVLDKRPSCPALAGMLLIVERGELHIWAANPEHAAYANVRTSTAEPGRALPDRRLLARIARNLPGETVTLTTDGPHLKIASGPSRWTLILMPDEDYPGWPADLLERDGNYADRVKPQGPDWREQQLAHGERFQRAMTKPWKPSNAPALYEPKAFGPGDWVKVVTDTETLVGQMATGPPRRSWRLKAVT